MATIVTASLPEDGLALLRLRTAWADETLLEGETGQNEHGAADVAERFAAWLHDERDRRRFWLALVKAQPVGMVNLLTVERMPTPGRDAGRWGYLGNLFVLPAHRRTGVATQLVEVLLADAAERGLERVVVHPSDASRRFWARTPFTNTPDLLVRALG